MSRQASVVPGARGYETSQLARLRYDAGLTQAELATKVGISLRTLQRIENGQSIPRPALAKRLAKRFGLTAGDLFLTSAPDGEDRPASSPS